MQLLPALVEADLSSFGEALTEVQTITGGWFASQQGGAFAAGPTRRLIEVLRSGGAAGVWQSSWGPTVYGIVDGPAAAGALAVEAAGLVGEGGHVVTVPFSNRGALVIHDTKGASDD
jgi:predicted sugar kinase